MQRLDRGFQPGPVGIAEKLADIRKMHGFRRRQTDNKSKPGRGFLATHDQIPAQKLIGRRVQEFGQFSCDFGGSGVVGFDLFHPAAIANRGADAKNGDGEPGPDPGNRIHEPFERRHGIGGGGLTGKQEQRNGTDNPARGRAKRGSRGGGLFPFSGPILSTNICNGPACKGLPS